MVPYANQNEASPSLGIANCETVATFGSSWEEWCHTRARMRPRRPWWPRTVKRTPLSGAPGRPNAVASDANQKEASPSLGAANCQTVVTFGSSWEAQRSGITRRPQSRMKPRRPWGPRTAKLSPLSWAPGGPSGMVSYADQSEASPSLRGANCEIAATFAGPWEAQRSGVICRPEGGLAVPGWCKLRTCRHVRVLLGGPAKWCHTQTKLNEASPSVGAANCETVATFVGSWEAQRNDFTRKLE